MSRIHEAFRKAKPLKQFFYQCSTIGNRKAIVFKPNFHSFSTLSQIHSEDFYISGPPKSPEKSIKDQLFDHLSSELDEEKSKFTGPSENLVEFFKKLDFQLFQEDGSSMVELRRWMGKEQIIIRFSIMDISRQFKDQELPEISILEPENLPIKIHIIVYKPGYGSLLFDSDIFDGDFGILHISLYDCKSSVQPVRASDTPNLKRQVFRCPFEDLDEDLKVAFEDYLEVRGITDDLAGFIRSYCHFKEQNEYMLWLDSIRLFSKA